MAANIKVCYYKTFISIYVYWFYFVKSKSISAEGIMLIGGSCFNGPVRQYFSLYRVVS